MASFKEIEINDLNVKYGRKQVLQNISFTIKGGEILVLVGPNGSGKSTVFRALTGIKHPESLTMSIDYKKSEIDEELQSMAEKISSIDDQVKLISSLD